MTRLSTPLTRMPASVLALLFLALITAGRAESAEYTLAEFKEYAAEKLPGISDAQLDKFAAMVDKDGDGVISSTEFNERLAFLEAIRQEGDKPAVDDPAPDKPVDTTPTGAPHGEQTEVAESATTRPATVLLITAGELAAAWDPFAEWKTRNGKATRIITVDQIKKRYKADCVQEQIRLCVRDQIDNHDTRWVLLGGDCRSDGTGLVPGGHTTVHAQERSGIPTDIVYLSKTTWDADGDGIYGEWEDDRKAISYPDGGVGLGRAPVRSAADVAAFTDKVIAYESRYPTSEFAKQMIYTCTDSPAYAKVRNSWDGYVSTVWDGQAGRFFADETPWDGAEAPGAHPLSAKNLVALINAEATGKLHIHGHGFLRLWALEDSSFTATHVGQLTNEAAYPLITTVSCFTGQYDGEEDPSIVESMIRQPKGGSVAIVAPIRTGKAHFHKASDFRLMVTEGKLDGTTQTMTRYWSHGLGGGLSTGEALMKAKADMAADARKTAGYHLCICELNLLGDPTLDMRANAPRAPTLECTDAIALGRQTIDIATDAPGSTVCLWKDAEVYSVVTLDAAGTVTLQIEPASTGKLLVTVCGANLNSVTKSISVR